MKHNFIFSMLLGCFALTSNAQSSSSTLSPALQSICDYVQTNKKHPQDRSLYFIQLLINDSWEHRSRGPYPRHYSELRQKFQLKADCDLATPVVDLRYENKDIRFTYYRPGSSFDSSRVELKKDYAIDFVGGTYNRFHFDGGLGHSKVGNIIKITTQMTDNNTLRIELKIKKNDNTVEPVVLEVRVNRADIIRNGEEIGFDGNTGFWEI